MSLSKKLFAPIAILAGVCVVLVGIAFWALSTLDKVISEQALVQNQLYKISEIRSLSRSLQRDTLNLIFEADLAEQQVISDKLASRFPAMQEAVKQLEDLLSEEDRDKLGNFGALQATVIGELTAIQQQAGSKDDAQLFEHFRAKVRPAERSASKATDDFDGLKREEFERLSREAEDVRSFSRLIIIGSGLLGLGIALPLAARIVSHGVNRPLRQLADTMERLAGGDTTSEVPMTRREDEIGTMARTVATFREATIERNALQDRQAQAMAEQKRLMEEQAALQAERMAEQERRLEEARQQEERARQLSVLIEAFEQQVAQSLSSVADASTMLLRTSDLMNGAVDDTNQRTLAVENASEQASANVQMVATATEEMTASIEEIARQIMNSKSIVDQVAMESAETTQKMQRLVDVSQQVAQIIGIIGDIAEQTNLLALNATIEAARAGEAGRGFAVVASEVKSLANQAARATEEIAQKIEAMQAEATTASESINRVGVTIERMTEVSSIIAAAMEEQNVTMRDISRNVQEAACGTEDVARNIRGVAVAAGETSRAAGDVRTASTRLSHEAEVLRHGVDTFLAQVRAA